PPPPGLPAEPARRPVATPAAPREADEQVVDAAIGLENLPRPWIGVHPRVALSAVTRRFPGVMERQPRDRPGGATREHPDLLGVRYGVEVAGEDRRHALVGSR